MNIELVILKFPKIEIPRPKWFHWKIPPNFKELAPFLHNLLALVSVCTPPPHASHAAIIMPSVMVLGGRFFEMTLGHEGRTLTMRLILLQKRSHGAHQPHPPCEDARSLQWEESPHPTVLAPWSQTSSLQNCEI